MADPSGHRPSLAGGREVSSSPSHANAKRQSLQRQRSAAYCAHAPDPYAAMASRGDWSTELWDICSQPGGPNMCCLSLWCPCIQYGLLLEQLPPGSVACAGSVAGGCALFCVLWLLGDVLGAVLLTKIFALPCSALVHSQTRGYIRRKYGIQSHPLHDLCITWCCGPCALCQEAREVVIRQAAEREDHQIRTPLMMSRSSSTHGPHDISTRSSLAGGPTGAGRAASGLISPIGSAPEPASPSASLHHQHQHQHHHHHNHSHNHYQSNHGHVTAAATVSLAGGPPASPGAATATAVAVDAHGGGGAITPGKRQPAEQKVGVSPLSSSSSPIVAVIRPSGKAMNGGGTGAGGAVGTVSAGLAAVVAAAAAAPAGPPDAVAVSSSGRAGAGSGGGAVGGAPLMAAGAPPSPVAAPATPAAAGSLAAPSGRS